MAEITPDGQFLSDASLVNKAKREQVAAEMAAQAEAERQGLETVKKRISFTSIYANWMPQKILDCMSEGDSLVASAVACGISRATLFDWKNPSSKNFKPEIKEACDAGVALSQAWWERNAKAGMWAKKDFCATTMIFNMKNRFKEDYGDAGMPQNYGADVVNPIKAALGATAKEDWDEAVKNAGIEDKDDHGN